MRPAALLFGFLTVALSAQAETGHAAWLRYAPINNPTVQLTYGRLPAAIVTLNDSPIITSARQELLNGIQSMLGRTPRAEKTMPNEDCILLATMNSVSDISFGISLGQRPIGQWWADDSLPTRNRCQFKHSPHVHLHHASSWR